MENMQSLTLGIKVSEALGVYCITVTLSLHDAPSSIHLMHDAPHTYASKMQSLTLFFTPKVNPIEDWKEAKRCTIFDALAAQ